jgi:hypothetical protein
VSAAGASRDIGLGAAPSPSLLDSAYAASHAVVIGINGYQFKRLNRAVPDAESVAIALSELGFEEGNTHLLLDSQASRQNIQDLLSVDIARKCGKDDRLLVYFAGHGESLPTPQGEPQGYFAPIDVAPDYLASRGISMQDIRRWSDLIPAKHILFVPDCCFSGLAIQRGSTGVHLTHPNYFAEITRRRVRQVITAARADQTAADGLFARSFVAGMKGDADLRGIGYVTGSALAMYLEHRVYTDSDGAQRPQFTSFGGDGEFVFAPPVIVHRPIPAPPSPPPMPRIEAERIVRAAAQQFVLQRQTWNDAQRKGFLANVRKQVPAGAMSDADVGTILEAERAAERSRQAEASRCKREEIDRAAREEAERKKSLERKAEERKQAEVQRRRTDTEFQMLSAHLNAELKRNDFSAADATIKALVELRPGVAAEIGRRRIDAEFQMLSGRLDSEIWREDFAAADGTVKAMLALKPDDAGAQRLHASVTQNIKKAIEGYEYERKRHALTIHLNEGNYTMAAAAMCDTLKSRATAEAYVAQYKELKARLEARDWVAAQKAITVLRGMNVDDPTLDAIERLLYGRFESRTGR